MSGLVIAMGLLSAGVGMVAAMHRLQSGARAYRRLTALYAVMPEGWTSWFVGGFSTLTVGTYWLWATAILVGWSVAGFFLIGLGLRLFWRA